jgi:hypothetical protein
MSEDFVRCYIGDISLFTLRNVQQESGIFDEWELMDGSEFNHKQSYGYKQVFKRDELLLEALAKRSVIAETKQPEIIKPSLFWNNALNIADVLTLLSVARARYYSTLAVEKNAGQHYSIGWGLMAREMSGNWDVVSISNLGRFVSQALTFIEQNPNWLEETGFFPGIYWYTQAQVSYLTAPSVLEMALYWVCVEILAVTYINGQGLSITNKKEQVKRFICDRGYNGSDWDFLDEVINDWYKTRNALFHEGKEPLSVDVLKTRRQQVRDFLSLVLVEMLQKQDEIVKKEIATRMQSY